MDRRMHGQTGVFSSGTYIGIQGSWKSYKQAKRLLFTHCIALISKRNARGDPLTIFKGYLPKKMNLNFHN